ncbi:MAG: riboflavin synthase [Candidatus Niameybacter stercoravium]|nr:riboflavin synthase [Candidatus Niameybacter stercoravium]
MFTGIVEEIGTIESVQKGEKFSVLKIKASKVLEQTQIGDSIATNGVCLTVTHMDEKSFKADVMAETLRKSNLGGLALGERVNLERALSLNSRLGGHIVSGHIDGVGEVVSLVKEDHATWVTIKAPLEILKYVVPKGSITIDGISLTVAYVDEEVFKVSIIPHTKDVTTLLTKKPKDTVNLECDLIGKYVEKLLGFTQETSKPSLINETFLQENGFM